MIKTLLTLLLVAATASATLIPADRLTDWTPGTRVGVPGGIDQYLPGGANQRTTLINVTLAPYNADKTGATDAKAAIQAAINAATTGQVVYLPAGTYRLDGSLTVDFQKDNITIRGAGVGVTFLDCRSGNSAIYVGTSSDYQHNWPSSGNTITAGLSKDSTTLTMADTSAFAVGNMVQIKFANQWDNTAVQAGAIPIASLSSFAGERRQTTRVSAKTSSTLTISPGIYHTPDAGLGATVWVDQLQTDGVGLEDFTVDSANGGSAIYPIYFEQCFGCWVKNVKSTNTTNYHIFFWDSLKCEIRHCYLDNRNSDGSNGAGILFDTDSACLVEDNIVTRMFPIIEINQGSCGNVFAYNLFEDSQTSGTIGANIDTNHGPHNSFNLYEGNIAGNVEADGYFGGVSQDTLYRNWITGTIHDQSVQSFVISLKRFTRDYSIIGNILGNSGGSTTPGDQYNFGQPNIGNGDSVGTAEPTTGDFWTDWATMKSNTPGNLLDPGSHFQELDLDVENSVIKKANYYIPTAAIPADEGLSGDTLSSSLYITAKPAYFASLTWPPFDPASPGTPNYDRIPASYRYVHGVDPGGGGTPTPTPTPATITTLSLTAGTLTIGQ